MANPNKVRTLPPGGNKPKKATVTTTADITVKVTIEAPSQNALMRILGAGAHAKLIPTEDPELFRVKAWHPEAQILKVQPV